MRGHDSTISKSVIGEYMAKDSTYRARLSYMLNNSKGVVDLRNKVANVILTNIDEQLVHAWSHLGDMGVPKSEFTKIRAIVKRRI